MTADELAGIEGERMVAGAGRTVVGDAGLAGIRSERQFMDALRALKRRSGLSYRDIARRMSRTAPRHAIAKSTLASLFARDSLPRRPGQLAALVDVLAGELTEPAEVTSQYLTAWSRLMAARPAVPGVPGAPDVPADLQAGYQAPVEYPAVRREPSQPAAAPGAGEPLTPSVTALLGCLTLLSLISFLFWSLLPPLPVPFWVVWLSFCWPMGFAVAALVRPARSGQVSSGQAPVEYLRIEYRDTQLAAAAGQTGPWRR